MEIPIESAQAVDPAVLGIYKSPTASFKFDRLVDYSVTCLGVDQDRCVRVCASQDAGFDLAFSQDASLNKEGAVWFRFCDGKRSKVRRRRAPDRPSNMCDWSMACQVLDACDGGAPVAAPMGASCVVGADRRSWRRADSGPEERPALTRA